MKYTPTIPADAHILKFPIEKKFLNPTEELIAKQITVEREQKFINSTY